MTDVLRRTHHGKNLSYLKSQQKDKDWQDMNDNELKMHLNQVVSEYYSNNEKMEVLQMRRIIKAFIIVLFPGKYLHTRKCRGLWQKAPKGWPESVPFVDPNNALPEGAKKKKDKKSSKPGRDVLAKMISFLIPRYKQKEARGDLTMPEQALSMPIQTTDIDSQEVDSIPQSQECINPIAFRKAVYDSTEVSDPDREWHIKQIEDDLKIDTEKGIVKDAYMPVHEEPKYVYVEKQNAHEEMIASIGNFGTLNLEDVNKVLQFREDTNQNENGFTNDEVNPLKLKMKVEEKEEKGEQIILAEVDLAHLPDIDFELNKLHEMLPIEEQNEIIDNVDTGNAFSDLLRHPEEEVGDGSYINVQNQGHDETPPVETHKKPTREPAAPQPPVNTAMMGFPKSNSGELTTGHNTAPHTYGNDAAVADNSRMITITVGDDDEMIYPIGNGKYIRIVKQKTVKPPPLQPDLVSQAMNSTGLDLSGGDCYPEQSAAFNQQTEAPQQMQSDTNFFGQEQEIQHQSLFGGPFGAPIQHDYQFPCMPTIENTPVRLPVEETGGAQDEDMDAASAIPTFVQEMEVETSYIN